MLFISRNNPYSGQTCAEEFQFSIACCYVCHKGSQPATYKMYVMTPILHMSVARDNGS